MNNSYDPGMYKDFFDVIHDQKIGSDNAYGQAQTQEIVVCTFYGCLRPVRATKLIDMNQVKAVVTHTIQTHYNESIKIYHRLKHHTGRTFGIVELLDVKEEHHTMEMTVKELL